MFEIRFEFFKKVCAAFFLVFLLSASAYAATPTVHLWSGNGGDANWSNAGNWATNGVPTSNEPGGTVILFGSNRTSTMNITNLVVDLVQFTGTGNTINGSIVLGVNGNVLTTNIQNDQGTNVINCPMNFTANAAILTVVTAGSLSLNGNITSAAGSNGLIVTNDTGTLTIGGSATNSYTGKTSVQSGMLILNSSSTSAIPGDLTIGRIVNDTTAATVKWLQGVEVANVSNVVVNLTGTMDLNGTAETIASLDVEGGNVSLGATGTSSLVVSGTTTIADGTIALGTNTFSPGSSVTMTGGHITATSGVLKLGGDVVATSSTSAGSTIALGSGSMSLNAATRNFNVSPATIKPELKITGVIADGTVVPSGLKKLGTGGLDLQGSQNYTFTGTATIDKGLVRLNTTNGHIFNGPVIIGNNVDASGTATLRENVQSNDLAPTTVMMINSSGIFDLGGEQETLASLTGTGSLSMGSSAQLKLGAASNFSYGGIISGSNGVLTKIGTGTMTLTGNNTYTGSTIVADGELDLNAPGSTAIATDVQIGDGVGATNSASLVMLQSGQLTPTSNITIKSDGLLGVNGKTLTSGSLTLTGGNVAIGTGTFTPGLLTLAGGTITGSTGSMVVTANINATSSATAGASITSKILLNTTPNIIVTAGAVQPELNLGNLISDGANGPQGFLKSGTGALSLINSTTNTYTGTTTIDAGLVTINSSSGVVIPGVLIIGNAIDPANSAILRELNSDDLTTTTKVTINASGQLDFNTHKDSIGSLSGTGNINDANSFSAGGDDSSSTFDGLISGAGGFTKIGVGTLTFTRNNTYANTTTVMAGSLVINGSQPMSSVQVAGTGILGGAGTVGATTVTTGTINPGVVKPSTLSITGNLSLASTSTLKFNIGTSSPGGFDALNVTGTVTLGGSTLALNFLPNLAIGGKLTLIANDAADALSGVFNGVAESQVFTPQSQQLTLSYVGGTGNDLDLTALNLPPTISSAAQALPNPATLGRPVMLAVIVTDLNLDTLSYGWNFGDGTTGSGATPTHVYTVPGTFSVNVTVDDGHGGTVSSGTSVTVVEPLAGEGPDSDGDGFSDSVETAAGTSPTDPSDTPTGSPAAAPLTLPAVKLAIKLNFAKPNNDKISLTGTIPIPAGFTPLNQKVAVAFGGVTQGFTLNAKGAGVDAKNTFKLIFKSKKGIVAAQTGKYTVKLAGNFAPDLAPDGLTNATVKTSTHTVPITLIFNKADYQLQRIVTYRAVKGKSGSAK